MSKIDSFVKDRLNDFLETPSEESLALLKKRMHSKNRMMKIKYYLFNKVSIIAFSALFVTVFILSNINYFSSSVDSEKIIKNNLIVVEKKCETKNNVETKFSEKAIEQNKSLLNEESEIIESNGNLNSTDKIPVSDKDLAETKSYNSNKVFDKEKSLQTNSEVFHGEQKTKNMASEVPSKMKTEDVDISVANNKDISATSTELISADNKEIDKSGGNGISISKNPVNSENTDLINSNKNLPIIIDSIIENIEKIVVHDTIRVFDTVKIFENTTPNEVLINTNSINKNFFSLDVQLEKGFFAYRIKESPGYSEMLDTLLSGMNYQTFGLTLNYHVKNFTFSSGMGLVKFKENFDYLQNVLKVDSTINTETINTGGYYEFENVFSHYNFEYEFFADSILIDSSWVNYTDSVLTDSIPVYFTDSTYFPTDTTITTVSYDSTHTIDRFALLNKYSYLEIPIVFGYSFGKKALKYSINGGIISGIFINAKGKGVLMGSENLIKDLKELPFMRLSFSVYLSAGVNWRIYPNLHLLGGITYRKQLNSVFVKSYAIDQRRVGLGLKIGARYVFGSR